MPGEPRNPFTPWLKPQAEGHVQVVLRDLGDVGLLEGLELIPLERPDLDQWTVSGQVRDIDGVERVGSSAAQGFVEPLVGSIEPMPPPGGPSFPDRRGAGVFQDDQGKFSIGRGRDLRDDLARPAGLHERLE